MTELIPSEELERLARGWLSMGHPAISTLATELLAARKEIQNLTTCLAGQTEIANRYMTDAMGLARELGIAKPRIAELEADVELIGSMVSQNAYDNAQKERDAALAKVEELEGENAGLVTNCEHASSRLAAAMKEARLMRDKLTTWIHADPAEMSYNGRLVPITPTGMREVIDEAAAAIAKLAKWEAGWESERFQWGKKGVAAMALERLRGRVEGGA